MSEGGTTCAVCLEEVAAGTSHSMDGCGHTFHATCIIHWMQRGHLSCPTCRQDLRRLEPGDALGPLTVRERAKYLRTTVARRRCAPPELKRMVAAIRRAEQRAREAAQECTEFLRANRETIVTSRRLRTKKYKAQYKVRELTRGLGLFVAPGMELPPIVAEWRGPAHDTLW